MRFEVDDEPAGGTVTVVLGPGERVEAAPDTLVVMDDAVRRDDDPAAAQFGVDDTPPATTYASEDGGTVTLAPPAPGGVARVNLGTVGPLRVRPGGALTWSADVSRSAARGPAARLFADADGTPLALSGDGLAFLAGTGAVRTREVRPDDPAVVDPAHLLAWTDRLAPGSDVGSAVRFEGSGRAWLRTGGRD